MVTKHKATKPYGWSQSVLNALMATVTKLPIKINKAQQAIADRLHSHNISMDELLAMKKALATLRLLNTEARKVRQIEQEVIEDLKQKVA